MTAQRDCIHGSLARSCPLCELQADLAASEARVKELKDNRDGWMRSCGDWKERALAAEADRDRRSKAGA